jgi:hypothetical protein
MSARCDCGHVMTSHAPLYEGWGCQVEGCACLRFGQFKKLGPRRVGTRGMPQPSDLHDLRLKVARQHAEVDRLRARRDKLTLMLTHAETVLDELGERLADLAITGPSK